MSLNQFESEAEPFNGLDLSISNNSNKLAALSSLG